MVSRKTKFLVGLFMAAGISIAVVAVIWLGMSRIFEQGRYYAVYFDESVQGLNVDSPVKYRGVAIGRVDQIGVAPDSRLIEVILKIEGDIKSEDDMVAQLRVVGITGSMFIELDRRKAGDGSRTPDLRFPTEYPVFATRPSEISELFRGIDEIVQKLNTLDIAGISDRLKNTLDHIDQSVVSTDITGISGQLKKTLADIDRSVIELDLPGLSARLKTTLASLEQDLDPRVWQEILTGVKQTVDDLKEVAGRTGALVEKAAGAVDETETGIVEANRRLAVIGRNLENASANLNRLLENLADQPSQALFGEPPPRRFPEKQGN